MNLDIKVIKITKVWSAGTKDIFIIVDKDDSFDTIQDKVEEACEDDAAGQSNGYQFEWIEETDMKRIRAVLTVEDVRMTSRMNYFKQQQLLIREQLMRLDFHNEK